MKWTREEFLELMTFGRVERQMFVELLYFLIRFFAIHTNTSRTEKERSVFEVVMYSQAILSCRKRRRLFPSIARNLHAKNGPPDRLS